VQQMQVGNKPPRPRCPYCGGPLERAVTPATNALTGPASFTCPPGGGTFTGFTVKEGRPRPDGDKGKALAAESHSMSSQPETDAPEGAPPPETPRPVDAPDDVVREGVASIDDPDGEEDIGGYGHGV
jgi:hypothetical protein